MSFPPFSRMGDKKHELVQSGSGVSPWQPVNVDMKCLVAHYRFVEESGQNIINKNPVFDGDLDRGFNFNFGIRLPVRI